MRRSKTQPSDAPELQQHVIDIQLKQAVKDGDVKAVSLALQHGADPSRSLTNAKNTPLHYAAKTGNITVVHQLLACEADINAANKYGMTPMHTAIIAQKTDVVGAMLDAGFDPEKKALPLC